MFNYLKVINLRFFIGTFHNVYFKYGIVIKNNIFFYKVANNTLLYGLPIKDDALYTGFQKRSTPFKKLVSQDSLKITE